MSQRIDAATALRYLRDLPDGDVLITAAHKRTTGLTVADLRELLEAARDGGWRDADDPPSHAQDVLVELKDSAIEITYFDQGRRQWGDPYWYTSEPYSSLVRRWRELPR